MEHVMNLHPASFEKMRSGQKTIELRLYDEKRKQVAPGDTVIFISAQSGEKLRTRVKELYLFDSFAELYRTLPLSECGYSEDELPAAAPSDMDIFYPEERQSHYGVVGIRIELLKNQQR